MASLTDFAGNPALIWTGRILSALIVLFLIFDGVIKLMEIEPVRKSFVELGYPVTHSITLGVIVLVCALLYALPQTAVLGAVLVTALCGGAITSHWRIGSPLFSHVLFGVYISGIAWLGLWLRSDQLRALLPLRV